jgi:carbonic anhydrase
MNTALGALGGYLFAQVPPYHDRSKGKASVLVLSCIDPRYTNDTAWFLTHNQELHADYDLVCFAGAELGVVSQASWRQTFFDHIDLAVKLHGVQEIWAISHMDCGMYKATLKIKDDTQESDHTATMEELKQLLAHNPAYANLGFRGYIISVNGSIKQVM